MADYKKEYEEMSSKAVVMATVLKKIEGRLVKLPQMFAKVLGSTSPQAKEENMKNVLEEINGALLDIRGDDEL